MLRRLIGAWCNETIKGHERRQKYKKSPARRTRVGTMGNIIRGHAARWNIFSFVAFLAFTLSVTQAHAVTPRELGPQKASPCVVASCSLLQESRMAAPAMTKPPQHGSQRTAGNPSGTMSPALTLAVALGLRMAQGPIERTPRVAARTE